MMMHTRTGFLTAIAALSLMFLSWGSGSSAQAGVLTASYHTASDVPSTADGNYPASGTTVNFSLTFAPPVGTELTLVKLMPFGAQTIGSFANLPHGQAVTATFNGNAYTFVANYFGGSGNDIVLEWANTRPMAWGNNGDGQVGNNSTTQSNLAAGVVNTGILAGKTIIAMAAGRNHSVALCSDGTLAAWGLNFNGTLGPNGGSGSTVPVVVPATGALLGKRVIAIAAGDVHNLALCSDGTVVAWGDNSSGQLGAGSGGASNPTPVAVSTSSVLAGQRVVAIAAGQSFSMALLANGTVATWGSNTKGQLGNGNTATSNVPVLVSATGPLLGKPVVAIAAGQSHALALCADGSLAAWGSNSDGQLGNDSSGTTANSSPLAPKLTGTPLATKTVTGIAAGAFHSLALCSDGTVCAWGQPTYGQLGTDPGNNLVPAAVNTSGALQNKTVTALAGGLSSTFALCSDGTLTAWGKNAFGELGTGNTTPFSVPQNVSTTPLHVGQRFTGVFSGSGALHTLAIVAAPVLPGQLTAGTLLSNGSFESGLTNWTVSDINQPFRAIQVRTNGFNPSFGLFNTSATDGVSSLTSGFEGSGPSVIRMSHDVTVSASEPFVRFDWRAGWDMLGGSGSTKPRTFAVTIEPSGGGPVLQRTVFLTAAPQTENFDTGGQTSAVDLSAFIGTTVRVCFDLTVPESNKGPGFFQLDNVRTAAALTALANPITGVATGIGRSGATLNGTVDANGIGNTILFDFGTTTNYGTTVSALPSSTAFIGDTAASKILTGLNENTNYHYRIRTVSSEGTRVGADMTFTTNSHAPAIVETGTSIVETTAASFYAVINPDNASTEVSFEYGLTTDYGFSAPAAESPVTQANAVVHAQISGLTRGTTYHYRVKAVNAGGTTFGSDNTFTPDPLHPGDPADPTVNTLPPTMVDRLTAQLNGIANGNGSNGNVDFQFGATTLYGSNVAAFPGTFSQSSNTEFGGTRNGLTAATTYHYRARALGPNGYVYGPDVTFATPSIGFPAASTDKAFGITQTSATVTGYASANNGPTTTVSFEYGLDTSYGSVVDLHVQASSFSFQSFSAQIPVSGDSVTYHYRIKATNNIGTTYGQDRTFNTPDLHEAKLYDLLIGAGTLSPAFDKAVTSYTLSLPFESASLWLTPTASTGIASVLVNGVAVDSGSMSEPIALNLGGNVLNILVTALDGMTQRTYTINVTRTAPVAGNLDLSFNGTGVVNKDFGVYDYARAVAVQPDGRIVIAGSAQTGDYTDFGVARYNADGLLDTAFAGTGKVNTDLGGGGDAGLGMALQSDGKIVVVGNAIVGGVTQFAVVRYNPNGTLDTTFNGTGKVMIPVGNGFSSASAVVVQNDGKIVVAGDADFGGTHGFALLRYHGSITTGTPGTLDTSFNSTGQVLTAVGSAADYVSSMVLQGDGKLVVGGYSYTETGSDSALVRYNTDGSLDPTFNGSGKATLSVSTGDDLITALALQADGKIVAVGSAYNGADADFSVLRFHGDSLTGTPGTLDTSFNTAGKIVEPIGTGDDQASGVTLQSDGKIVVAGRSDTGISNDCVVARYNSNGSHDLSFRGTGRAVVNLGDGNREVGGVALQGDGKIVVATSLDSNWSDFSILRFLGDGPGISVEQPLATTLLDGISSVSLGGALPGVSRDVVFTIRNTGTADLTGLNFMINGLNESEFSVLGAPAGPVLPQDVVTFTVRVTPAVTGLRSAALHIASNVTGNTSVFDIALTGTGFLAIENWKNSRFGSQAADPIVAGDDADPNGNGIQNLLEYALNGDPTGSATGNAILPQAGQGVGNAMQLAFVRHLDRNDITLTVQACDDLTDLWTDLARSVNGAPFTLLTAGATLNETGSGNSRSVTVCDMYQVNDPAHPRRFMRLQVTRP